MAYWFQRNGHFPSLRNITVVGHRSQSGLRQVIVTFGDKDEAIRAFELAYRWWAQVPRAQNRRASPTKGNVPCLTEREGM